MNLEQQLKIYKDISKKITELEEQKKALGATIMAQMQNDKVTVADYIVRRYERLSIKTTIEEARSLQAVKMEEVVDKDKIKSLHLEGKPINGISTTRYIVVTTQKSNISIDNPPDF